MVSIYISIHVPKLRPIGNKVYQFKFLLLKKLATLIGYHFWLWLDQNSFNEILSNRWFGFYGMLAVDHWPWSIKNEDCFLIMCPLNRK